MIRRVVVAATAFVILGCVAPGSAAQEPTPFSVMTQNMDAGTDLNYVFYALTQTPPLDTRPYVDLTLAEIEASNIPDRAGHLAAEIASRMPYLVTLEEVTLWRIGDTPETATTVLYDQLELLTKALSGLGAKYEVVAVNNLSDVALPTTGGTLPGAVRYTDRDVLLARSDLSPSQFQISDVHAHTYKAALTLGAFTAQRGFISALVRVNNQVFRIAGTHLEDKLPTGDNPAAIQELQASELLSFMRNSPQPVILSGDFNADAILGTAGSGPDNSGTVAFIESGGYADSWAEANPGNDGPTWPLFLEDQPPPDFYVTTTPFERIDLIFSKGLPVLTSTQVGANQTYPAAASDHVGVLTTFRLGH